MGELSVRNVYITGKVRFSMKFVSFLHKKKKKLFTHVTEKGLSDFFLLAVAVQILS